MLFYEAASKMKVGDTFKPVSKNYDGFLLIESGKFVNALTGGAPCFFRDFIFLEGEIIPAEPEVLTVEQLSDLFYTTKRNPPGIEEKMILVTKENLTEITEKCRKNFRLERDKELRPAIELLKEIPDTSPRWLELKVMEVLKNIPPLEKEDN